MRSFVCNRVATYWLLPLVLVPLVLPFSGCNGKPAAPASDGRSGKPENSLTAGLSGPLEAAPSSSTLAPTVFADEAERLGLSFVYDNGASGQLLMVEATGGGCGWLDLDADGRRDLYCCQGGDAGAGPHPQQPSDRLFRRVGVRFVDISEAAGIQEFYYGQGVAVADYDDDGFDDIYVTNVGRNTLWRNLGDGTFEDVTEACGVGDVRWSSTAAWGDLDLDGDVDLYVCNYTVYDPQHPIICRNTKGQPSICHPKDVEPWPDECFINQGNGEFTAEAQRRGLFGPGNKALSAVIADFTNDGWPDIYVANDTTPNFFFRNLGQAMFTEEARLRGCAVDRNGARQASMGLAVGDYDQNGLLDVYSTHFHNESNTLYKNVWPRGFEDVTGLEGLHEATLGYLAFGTLMVDFDLDGLQELFVANGHIDSHNPAYEMTAQLFKYNGSTARPKWEDFSQPGGPYFQQRFVGRGVARSDIDGDGDQDLIVVHQNKPLAALRNDSGNGKNWIQLSLLGRASNRRGINARVTVRQGERSWTQQLCGGTSYLVTNEPTLVFGFGADNRPLNITVQWPSGRRQELQNVTPNQPLRVQEPAVSPAN
jgi:enediyne biosynthesis protein E4